MGKRARTRTLATAMLTLALLLQSVITPALLMAEEVANGQSGVSSVEVSDSTVTEAPVQGADNGNSGSSQNDAENGQNAEDLDSDSGNDTSGDDPDPQDEVMTDEPEDIHGAEDSDTGSISSQSDGPVFGPLADISSVTFSNLTVLAVGGGGAESNTHLLPSDSLRITGDFSIPAGSYSAGDTFHLYAGADLLNLHNATVILDGDPDVRMTILNDIITFTLLEDWEGSGPATGSFFLTSGVQFNAIEWGSEVTFTFTDGADTDWEFPFTTGPYTAPDVPPNEYSMKDGFARSTPHSYIVWRAYTGMMPEGGAYTIVDDVSASSPSFTINCDASYLVYGSEHNTGGWLNTNTGVNNRRGLTAGECTPTGVTVTGTHAPGESAILFIYTNQLPVGYLFHNTATISRGGETPMQRSASVQSIGIGGDITGPVTPIAVQISAQTCENGEMVAPSITNPDISDGTIVVNGVLYSNGSVVVNGDVLEVRLSAQRSAGQTWEIAAGSGWTVDANDSTLAHYFDNSIAVEPCEQAELALPDVIGAVCEGGVEPSPSVVGVDDTADIDYTASAVDAEGNFTVTATLVNTELVWPDTLPSNDLGSWALVNNVMTFTGHVTIVPCEQVPPVTPEIVGNVCEGGVYVPPTVDFGIENDEISYSNGVAAGGVITAEAELLGEGTSWGDLTGTGWTVDPEDATRATYAGTYVEAPCAPVVPAAPIVQDAVCVGGELIAPMVTTSDTDRITYVTTGDVVSGGTVVVTATLANGFSWDLDMPEGWTINPENAAEATFVIELADVECTPVAPVVPVLAGHVCVDGAYVAPTVTANGPEGVTYTNLVAANGIITATATLANGYAWDAAGIPTGWTIDPENAAVANYTGSYVEAPCTPVVPSIPVVTPAVCEEGGAVPPTLSIPAVPGIDFEQEGDVVAGGTVTITATLQPGYEWGDLAEGWTIVDATTATLTVQIPDGPDCEVKSTPVVSETPVAVVTDLPETGTGSWNSQAAFALASAAMLLLAAVGTRLKVDAHN